METVLCQICGRAIEIDPAELETLSFVALAIGSRIPFHHEACIVALLNLRRDLSRL